MTERKVHHPTWGEYMKLTGGVSTARLAQETERMNRLARQHLPVERGTLRDSIDVGYYVDDPEEVHRLLDATLYDLEHGNFKAKVGGPPLGRIWPPPELPSCGRTCRTTPCDTCPESQGAALLDASAVQVAETQRRMAEHVQRVDELKGPLPLRLELWWMRVRLDPRPRTKAWTAVAVATSGTVLGGLLGASAGIFAWLPTIIALPCLSLLAWLACGGWTTPTVDQAIREAP
jgi:hypothetical protein